MADELLFTILFSISFMAFWIVRGYYVRRTRNPSAPRTREERREAMKKEGWTGYALVLLTPLELIFIILYLWNPSWVPWTILPIPEILRWLGLMLILLSIPMAAWVHRTLGAHYSYALETKEVQKLITVGPYSRVRHPLYSVHNLFNLGMIFLTANLPLTVFALIGVPLVYARMKREEVMMIKQFGKDYEEYKQQTGRIFPKLSEIMSKKK